jgi:hypothetical protein
MVAAVLIDLLLDVPMFVFYDSKLFGALSCLSIGNHALLISTYVTTLVNAKFI